MVTGKGKADKIIAEGPGIDDDLILPGSLGGTSPLPKWPNYS